MPGTLELADDRIYSEQVVCRSLGLSQSALDAARRRGELRSFKAGQSRVYLGSWLRQWIERAATPEPEPAGVGSC